METFLCDTLWRYCLFWDIFIDGFLYGMMSLLSQSAHFCFCQSLVTLLHVDSFISYLAAWDAYPPNAHILSYERGGIFLYCTLLPAIILCSTFCSVFCIFDAHNLQMLNCLTTQLNMDWSGLLCYPFNIHIIFNI